MLVNGVSGNMISIRDRGLLYGDGVFRTLRVSNGQAPYWQLHYRKLQHDCESLGIVCPDFACLSAELTQLLVCHPDAILKIIVTRGAAHRGYAPPENASASHIWDVSSLPVNFEGAAGGVTLVLCELRLGQQPRLAGIKHLNRLENVLAASECKDADEGLLRDTEDRVIEGVSSNIFLISHGRLITPGLSRCGVAGVQRDRVIAYAGKIGMPVDVRDVDLAEVSDADEVFLTNSVFGLRSVAVFGQRIWTDFGIATRIRYGLDGEVEYG